jgi:hypothetical protein
MGTERVAYDELAKQLRRTSRLFFWSLLLWPLLVGWLLTLPLAFRLFGLARRPLGSRWSQRMTLAGVTALVALLSQPIWFWLGTELGGYDGTGRYQGTLPSLVPGALVVLGVGLHAWAHLDVARHHRLPSLEHWWEKVLAPFWSAATAVLLVLVAVLAPFGMSEEVANVLENGAVIPGVIAGIWMLVRLIWAHDWLLEDLDAAAADARPSVVA